MPVDDYGNLIKAGTRLRLVVGAPGRDVFVTVKTIRGKLYAVNAEGSMSVATALSVFPTEVVSPSEVVAMSNLDKMSKNQMREALAAILAEHAECLEAWDAWSAPLPRKMNAGQREQSAYLRGRLSGLHYARHQIEMRAPIDLQGS
jgi:hypothetical protein